LISNFRFLPIICFSYGLLTDRLRLSRQNLTMKRAAPDTAADVSSASAPAQRPVTGPAATIAAIEADDPAAMERCWVPELALEKIPTEQ
jgi:hypothetical protein